MKPGVLLIRSAADADDLAEQVRTSAAKLHSWIASFGGGWARTSPCVEIRASWVSPGRPSRAHYAIEQDQSDLDVPWSHYQQSGELLSRHVEANGFRIAPGAHAAQPLDVMSANEGLVGAEVFAAVDPRNNRKLAKELAKLDGRHETYRYVFFASPLFPGTSRRPQLERSSVQVWSVDV